METIRYLRALGRSWWLIVVTLIAGGAGGYLVYHRTTPTYQSSVRMIVASELPNADSVSASALTAQQATSLAGIATTGPAINAAIAASGAGPAANGVSVASSASSSFVVVTVSSSNATVARNVAAAFPATLPTSQRELAGVTSSQFKLNTVSEPAVAADPVSPDPVRDIGLGLAAGLILGIAIAILRETLNRTLRDTDALRELTGLTVLGTIPRDMPKRLLPAMSDPRSARAEAYRQVRTTLLNQATARPLVVAVTSAALGEGKTSVACNVAAIFSRAGHRVALVDADLRRPRVAAFFELTAEDGLSEVLAGTVSLSDAMTELDDGRLGILTAGKIPTNPAELLGSQAMLDTLAALARQYEFVIIDTPPVLPVTDALVIAPMVHGIILVVRLGGTTQERIEHAMSGIERVKATIVGVVPNQADQGADRSYGYAYRYSTSRRRPRSESVPSPSGSTVPGEEERSRRSRPRNEVVPDPVHKAPSDAAAVLTTAASKHREADQDFSEAELYGGGAPNDRVAADTSLDLGHDDADLLPYQDDDHDDDRATRRGRSDAPAE